MCEDVCFLCRGYGIIIKKRDAEGVAPYEESEVVP